MRLSKLYHASIVNVFTSVFPSGEIYLFGSRVDDSLRGGDIDLFIETDEKENLFARKVRFLSKLKQQIGDQKIDIVFNEDPTRLIEQEIRNQAVIQARLEKVISEVTIHIKRIDDAFEELTRSYTFPLDVLSFQGIVENHVSLAFIDQIIYRFSKALDTIGAKLFKMFLESQGENTDRPFLDILNSLEKISIVQTDLWFELREIRNEIAHEYDDTITHGLEVINAIYSHKSALHNIVTAIQDI